MRINFEAMLNVALKPRSITENLSQEQRYGTIKHKMLDGRTSKPGRKSNVKCIEKYIYEKPLKKQPGAYYYETRVTIKNNVVILYHGHDYNAALLAKVTYESSSERPTPRNTG